MSEEKQYPSLGQQAKNLAQFSWDLMKYLHNNKGAALMVPDEVYKQRTEICKGCEKFDDLQNKCMECGCFIPAKAKLVLDSCPLDKWTDLGDQWENIFNGIMDKVEEEKE